MNPFQKIKDAVIISMLIEVAKIRKLHPEKMIEVLVRDAYLGLK